LGSGKKGKGKKIFNPGKPYQNPVTLDMNEAVEPDVVFDLDQLPLPFRDQAFDEIHAYEVLEHTGKQGDWKFFFAQFDEFWRILKPGGMMYITVPYWDSIWAWGDPGHTRVLNEGTFSFLERVRYKEDGPRTDYTPWYKGDFKVEIVQQNGQTLFIALRRI